MKVIPILIPPTLPKMEVMLEALFPLKIAIIITTPNIPHTAVKIFHIFSFFLNIPNWPNKNGHHIGSPISSPNIIAVACCIYNKHSAGNKGLMTSLHFAP